MIEFLASFRSEYKKIISRRKSLVLLAFTFLFVLGASLVGALWGRGLNTGILSGQYYSVWILSIMMKLPLPLFILMTAIDSTTGEFQDEAIGNCLLMPVDRHHIYLGKLAAIMLYAGELIIATLAASILGAVLLSGFGSLSMLPSIVLTYLSAFMALALITVIISLLALFFRTTSLALVSSILLWFAFNAVGMFWGQLNAYLPTTLAAMYGQLFQTDRLLSLISYYIIFTILGIFKFQTKEA